MATMVQGIARDILWTSGTRSLEAILMQGSLCTRGSHTPHRQDFFVSVLRREARSDAWTEAVAEARWGRAQRCAMRTRLADGRVRVMQDLP